jgi:HAD superfamily hydrolase (TIGR01509 family)
MNAPWKLPKAVLWDMDGTLVDTEPMWIGGEHALAAQHGALWTEEDSLHLVGSDLLAAAVYIKKRIGGDMTPKEIVDWLGARVAEGLREQQDWRPGARELFEQLRDAGVPQALVTMSYAYIAEPVVEALGFDAVVTGDSVTHGKPHPEPYLRAAELLGVRAADCIAIEDSRTGAASANAAGCFVVAVPHAVNVPEAPFRAVVTTLDGLRIEDLARLAGLGHPHQ